MWFERSAGEDGRDDEALGDKSGDELPDWVASRKARLEEVVVEPVFGPVKNALGFTRFLLRGLWKVTGEWSLVSTADNLRRLALAREPSASSTPVS